MSVSNQTDKIYGSGNGVTVTFSYPFKIFDPTQLLVYLINVSTGVVTGPMILNTDYTVIISAVTEGGSVTFTVAPATGYNWFIKRSVPYTQAAVIPSEGVFPGKQFENQLDLMTMMVIQDQEAVSRSFQLATTSIFAGPVYMADPQDGMVQQYNAAAGAYENVLINGGTALPSPAGGGYVYSNGTAYTLQTAISVANTVNGTAITNLPGIPSGAGAIPEANLPAASMLNAYPIGSIYISTVSTNPGTIFGGTWVALGQGRVLMGVGTGTDINSVTKTVAGGDTGGEYKHTQLVTELVGHTHNVDYGNTGSGNTLGNGNWAVAGSFNSESTGGGQAMPIVMPYLGVYMWNRTA